MRGVDSHGGHPAGLEFEPRIFRSSLNCFSHWRILLLVSRTERKILICLFHCRRAFPHSDRGKITGVELAHALLIIVSGLILVVGGISTLSLFGFHSYLMCTNQTTWESVSRRRISYLKKLRDDYNPFHLGYCTNVYTFCCQCYPRKWEQIYRRSMSNLNLVEELWHSFFVWKWMFAGWWSWRQWYLHDYRLIYLYWCQFCNRT